MSFVVEWDNAEHTVILTVYGEPFSWEDAFAAQREASRMIDAAESQVSSIIDLSQVRKVPLGAMTQIKNLISQSHPRIDYIVLVGMNPFARAIENRVRSVYRAMLGQKMRRSFFAKDLAEAREQLRRLHQHLAVS